MISGVPESIPQFNYLNLCGEKIETNILEWAKSMDIYNGYGPTEATTPMTISKVLPGSSLDLTGHSMKILTASVHQIDSLTRMPAGGVGKLCFSGTQLP